MPADWRERRRALRRRQRAIVERARGDPLAVGPAAAGRAARRRRRAPRERVRLGLAPDHADVPRADAAAGAVRRRRRPRLRRRRAGDRGGEARLGARRGRRPQAGRRSRSRSRTRAQRRRGRRARSPTSRSTRVPLAPLLLVNAPPPVHERVAAAITPEVRHVIVSGHRRRRARPRVAPPTPPPARARPGARHRGRVARAALGREAWLTSAISAPTAPSRGRALGQLAAALPGGGLLITASRLVEFGARAAILLAPGLFRLDLTPQEETLGLYPRPLGAYERRLAGRARRRGTATATRRDAPDGARGPVRDARRRRWWPGCTCCRSPSATPWPPHFVAKCEIRPESR